MSKVRSCVLTHSHVQGNQGNVQGIIMCTYLWSCVSKEVSETHHMYLLTVTCNKINELTCSVCNKMGGKLEVGRERQAWRLICAISCVHAKTPLQAYTRSLLHPRPAIFQKKEMFVTNKILHMVNATMQLLYLDPMHDEHRFPEGWRI